MRRSSRSTIFPILILLAAGAIWAVDMYRNVALAAPESEKSSSIPSQPAATLERYEVIHDCSLADDKNNDGDSFRVKLPGGKTEIIRLYFVDTPESAFKSYGGGENNHERITQQAADLGGMTPQQAVEIGKKAKAYTLNLLTEAPFTLYTKWDDPYGDRRYRAFLEVTQQGKKRFLHELLVENGLARIHTKGATLPDGTPERQQKDRLFDLQRTAKSKEVGAWGL